MAEIEALRVICGRLPCDFTAAQLRRAYRTASLRAHPDRGSSAAFAAVAAAYETLADPDRRRTKAVVSTLYTILRDRPSTARVS